MEQITLMHWLALLLGLVYGLIASRSGFCFYAGVRGFSGAGNVKHSISFVLAMLVALFGTQILVSAGTMNLEQSVYLVAQPNLLLIILGSLIFSCGMVLANGCPNRHLVLLGQGNLRSLLVLVITGIFAYISFKGLLALPRQQIGEMLAIAPLTQLQTSLTGWLGKLLPPLVRAFILSLPLLWLVWKYKTSIHKGLDGALIGLLIVAGWYLTAVIGFDEFDPRAPESLTFTVPLGEGLLYLMTYTGSTLKFMTSVIAGVLLGSILMALISRRGQLHSFASPAQMLRMLLGAALMGIGGVMALGCTVGQGLSGFSTLSLGSIVAIVSIYLFTRMLMPRVGTGAQAGN